MVWPSWSRPSGHAGFGSDLWREKESRAKKTAVKKRLSPLLTHSADDDGGLKMSNNAAERAMRPIALGGKSYFLLVSTPRTACGISTLIETVKTQRCRRSP